MLKHTFVLTFVVNLLITTKVFSQDFKGKATSYLTEAYGDTTTSGDILNAKTFTATHDYFPIGTVIDIVNLKNKKVIQVIINDNEISDDDLVLEFTDVVAHALGMRSQETIDVKLSILTWGNNQGNVAFNSKKEPDFKVDFRKYDYVKSTEQKKN
jgi:rare lipoprotein A